MALADSPGFVRRGGGGTLLLRGIWTRILRLDLASAVALLPGATEPVIVRGQRALNKGPRLSGGAGRGEGAATQQHAQEGVVGPLGEVPPCRSFSCGGGIVTSRVVD